MIQGYLAENVIITISCTKGQPKHHVIETILLLLKATVQVSVEGLDIVARRLVGATRETAAFRCPSLLEFREKDAAGGGVSASL